MPRDWLTSSEDDRRALYAVTKRVVDGHFRGNWSSLYAEAFGVSFEPGVGYEDNFRKGKISRKNASAIARWLDRCYPAAAKELAHALNEDPPPDWAEFLTLHGRVGGLFVLRPSELNVIGLAGRSAPLHQPVLIGEEFLLQLTTAIGGEAVGWQQSGGQWFHLPLSDESSGLSVEAGTNIMPRSAHTALPLPLCEESDRGTVRFAILITPGDLGLGESIALGGSISEYRLNEIAASLQHAKEPFELHTLTITVQ